MTIELRRRLLVTNLTGATALRAVNEHHLMETIFLRHPERVAIPFLTLPHAMVVRLKVIADLGHLQAIRTFQVTGVQMVVNAVKTDAHETQMIALAREMAGVALGTPGILVKVLRTTGLIVVEIIVTGRDLQTQGTSPGRGETAGLAPEAQTVETTGIATETGNHTGDRTASFVPESPIQSYDTIPFLGIRIPSPLYPFMYNRRKLEWHTGIRNLF